MAGSFLPDGERGDTMNKWLGILAIALCPLFVNSAAEAAAIVGKDIQYKDVKGTVPVVTSGASPAALEALNAQFVKNLQGIMADYIKQRDENRSQTALPESIKKSMSFAGNYRVYYDSGPWVSLVQNGYLFIGGAHGMPFENAVTVNLDTGKNYKLADLFKPGFDYKTYLTERVKNEAIERKELDLLVRPEVTDQQKFYLTEDGLVLYYAPYEIAPYSNGFVRFMIPYRDLAGEWVREVADIEPGFILIGEEPFWHIDIRPGEFIRFRGVFETLVDQKLAYDRPAYTGDTWVYNLGSDLSVTIVRQPTASTMADNRHFECTAYLKWQGKTYKGGAQKW